MSNAEALVNLLRELYPARPAHCVDSQHDSHLLVYEGDDFRSYLIPRSGDPSTPVLGLLVENPMQQPIYLLALDTCFFDSSDPKRCDCLLFDNHYLCFVELKLNVNVRRQAADKLNDARSQLGSSIQFFKINVLPNLSSAVAYKLEAYAVMQDNIYPSNRASRNTVFVRFLEEHGVELFEKNTKSFS